MNIIEWNFLTFILMREKLVSSLQPAARSADMLNLVTIVIKNVCARRTCVTSKPDAMTAGI